MKRLEKDQKGFTLVELLVVIAIIGILAVVAVPALFKNINKAKVADLESDYSAIKSASLSYYADTNKVPAIMSDLKSHMDSLPTESALGEGAYALVKDTYSNEENLYLAIGERKFIANHDSSNEHKCSSTCYQKDTGITLTEEQLEKIVKDLGEGKVFASEGTAFDEIKLGEGSNVTSYIGENIKLRLVLINNTNL